MNNFVCSLQVSSKELNPFWKNGGDGFAKPNRRITALPRVGDGGRGWKRNVAHV